MMMIASPDSIKHARTSAVPHRTRNRNDPRNLTRPRTRPGNRTWPAEGPRESFWLFLIFVVGAAAALCLVIDAVLPRPLFIAIFAMALVAFLHALRGIAIAMMAHDPASPLPDAHNRAGADTDADVKGGREWTA